MLPVERHVARVVATSFTRAASVPFELSPHMHHHHSEMNGYVTLKENCLEEPSSIKDHAERLSL
eukprot:scaffold3920_cov76-Cylindrotheca_fusiformis.AAC.2